MTQHHHDNKDWTRRTFITTLGTISTGTILSPSLFSHEQVKTNTIDRLPDTKVRIGQIGTGHVHAYKTDTLRKMTDCFEFVAVAEDDPNLRKKAQQSPRYRKLRWMSSEELLAREDVQAIAVEAGETTNLKVALKCLLASKHIHLDKPPGTSLPEFENVLKEAKRRKLTVQLGYMLRNNPAIQFCINAVKTGLIGKVFDIEAVMSRYDDEEGRKRVAGYVGGSFFLLGCHLLDLVVTLLGEPSKVHSFIQCTKNDGCQDSGMAVFEYQNGCMATMRASIAEVDGFQQRHIIIRGQGGTIIVNPLEVRGNASVGKVQMTLLKASGEFQKGYHDIAMPVARDRYEGQWREFADVVNGSIPNPYSYEHDYLVHKYLLKICGIGS